MRDRACEKCGSDRYVWAFTVDVGKDGRGQRKQRSRSGFATKRGADRALREVLASVDAGRYVEPSRMTLASYLTEHWLPARKPKQREAGRRPGDR